jgi:UDP-N-acetylmuramate dehydrogenase
MQGGYNAVFIDAVYRSGGISEDEIILGVHLTLKKDDIEGVRRRIKDFLQRRKATQPLHEKTAGCVFKNPEDEPAGRLIEMAGCKGLRVGDIEVSHVHANFFLNKGDGKASDFLRLMDRVSEMVKKRFGVVLEPEIRIVGFGGRG